MDYEEAKSRFLAVIRNEDIDGAALHLFALDWVTRNRIAVTRAFEPLWPQLVTGLGPLLEAWLTALEEFVQTWKTAKTVSPEPTPAPPLFTIETEPGTSEIPPAFREDDE